MSALAGVIVLLLALRIIAYFFVLLAREDEERRHRAHPHPEDGGSSFGDTSYWGGFGRPGA